MVSVILKFLELASDYIVKSEFLEEKNELKRNLPKHGISRRRRRFRGIEAIQLRCRSAILQERLRFMS